MFKDAQRIDKDFSNLSLHVVELHLYVREKNRLTKIVTRLTYPTNVNGKWMQDLVLKRMMVPKSVPLKRLVNGGKNGG